MNTKKLSIIVCTFNRYVLLYRCLIKIESLIIDTKNIEVLIVDNNSTDETKSIAKNFCSKYTNWSYFFESNQGLSYARNRGAQEAKGEWLFYIDDDGVIGDKAIKEVFRTINEHDFKFFTGIVHMLDDGNTPKWFPYEWGNTLLKGKSIIRSLDLDYISGGIMIIEKNTFEDLGPFNINLGMNGSKIGYGEETDLEIKARKKNISLGINPGIILYHTVAQHKKNVSWILRASFSKGYYGSIINSQRLIQLPKIILSLILRITKNFIKSSFKILFDKEYYWQNYVIDNFSSFLAYLGSISAILKIINKDQPSR